MATSAGAGDRGGGWQQQERVKLGACVVGVVGSLLVYGVLQERVMTIAFQAKDGTSEVFKFSLFLVACNRLVTCVVAAATLLLQGKTKELRPVAPLWCYASVSLSNVIATTCQYEALKWVSFAVQTLGKCAKMFPVMLWGLLMMKRKYSWKELGVAGSITAGCFVFFMSGNTASRLARHAAGGSSSSLYGLALMAGYLTADGYTSTFQDRLFKGHAMTTYNQVLYTSLFSILLSMTGLVTSGQLMDAVGFLQRHPDALLSIFLLSGAATAGSLCISYTIKSFGALIFAMIMTTRQFLSILLSSLIFGNKLTAGQWAGTAIVFLSLYYQTATKKPKAKTSDPGNGDQDSAKSKADDLETAAEPQDGKQQADAKLAAGAGLPRRTATAALAQ